MFKIAYCSNVHTGSDLDETRSNLQKYARRVKEQYSPEKNMGIGLWLSARSASQLISDPERADEFERFLADVGLDPFTFNGFPFGNFHEKVVKRNVYLPTWYETSRLDYTRNLAQLINRFAGDGICTISTMPIAWGNPLVARGHLAEAGRLLRDLAEFLSVLESESGRLIHVCIEPEPGCVIQYGKDVVDFFENHLLTNELEPIIRRHICVCHDICHAVVMCESQREVLSAYQAAGIGVGKVQISSAVVVDFDRISREDRMQAYAELSGFAEDRFLHQTTIQDDTGDSQFFEDLPLALRTIDDARDAAGTWRIHFHIPVYLSNFGFLHGSQQEIVDCVSCCREYSAVEHFEVETYAWNVLPQELRQDDLAVGIADEMKWFSDLANKHLS